MTYEEYYKAMDKLLKVQELFSKIAFDTKGQRQERAKEGVRAIIEARSVLNDLYGGIFDDED